VKKTATNWSWEDEELMYEMNQVRYIFYILSSVADQDQNLNLVGPVDPCLFGSRKAKEYHPLKSDVLSEVLTAEGFF
jgi:hypothetical protein